MKRPKAIPVVVRVPQAVRDRFARGGDLDDLDVNRVIAAIFDYLTGTAAARLKALAARHALVMAEVARVQAATEEGLRILARARDAYVKVRDEYLNTRAEATAMAVQMQAAKRATSALAERS